ncbi:MAG: hypothetical protein ACFFCE_15295 [Promethearchaeota archaeon]
MSEYTQKLKNPIENVLLFLGVVFSILGIFTFYIVIREIDWYYIYDGWSLLISGSILLSIGISLLYLRNKLIQLNLESEIK